MAIFIFFCQKYFQVDTGQSNQLLNSKAFAKVDRVDGGSPASAAVSCVVLAIHVFSSENHPKFDHVFSPFITLFRFQGLNVGDEILKFGSLTVQNFQGMQNLAAVVQHSKDVRTNFA